MKTKIIASLCGCLLYIFSLNAQSEQLNLFVQGVCGMCKERIEKTALETRGVKTANWDMATRNLALTVSRKKFDEDQLHQNIAAVGHDTRKAKAPDDIYEALDGCCHYREFYKSEYENPEGSAQPKPEQKIKDEGASKDAIQGMVYERNLFDERIPLPGVNVFWLGAETGTVTGVDGHFSLAPRKNSRKLVVSYVGYQTDTIDMADHKMVAIVLSEGRYLDQVEVKGRKRSTEVSFLNPVKQLQIGEKELLKAACCNLSESFETTPSVDVVFTDAITGTRQIQMLGLAGPYVQTMRENIPEIRGLAALSGFSYTPGPWVEGIQLNLGTGSVVNGFESMSGQINVELKKPEDSEKLYLNAYANQGGRLEANINWTQKLSDRWSTALFLHGGLNQREQDPNGDGFLDMPLRENLIALNRWKYEGKNGWMGQFGLKGARLRTTGGQRSAMEEEVDQLWQSQFDTDRLEGWAKIGKVFPNRPYASTGLQLSFVRHEQDARFGERLYLGEQTSLYANWIYQNIIGNTNHQFKTGLSYQFDQIDETAIDQQYLREESVPGAFFEYTWTAGQQFSLVAGIRGDFHNQFGFFATPRLHLRYNPEAGTALRISAGRGQRTANIFAENIGGFASNRTLQVFPEVNDHPYGLDPEISWNFGLNITKEVKWFGRPATLGTDYYFTTFQNQVVADWDNDPQQLLFYNLEGQSYSHSLQGQVDFTPLERLDIRLAYRYNDVQTDYRPGRLQRPLLAPHRFFANAAYATPSGWGFDLTSNWQGTKRIPNTQSNPEVYRARQESPDFVVFNAQVSKSWKDKFELYLGAENLFDFRQQSPILAADDPFGPYFDSSLVWGPIFGRNIYIGGRFRLE